MAGQQPPVHPNFDNRIMTMPSMASSQAGNQGGAANAAYGPLVQPTRGYMVQQVAMPGCSAKGYFNFQYNPSTIENVNNIQTGGVAQSLLFPNSLQQPDLAVPLNQTVSWTLLYDRTYELWDSAGYNAQHPGASFSDGLDPTSNGVWADVYQLMWFTGMEQTLDATDAAAVATFLENDGGSASSPTTVNGGIMMMVPCWVYFGGFYPQIPANNPA